MYKYAPFIIKMLQLAWSGNVILKMSKLMKIVKKNVKSKISAQSLLLSVILPEMKKTVISEKNNEM